METATIKSSRIAPVIAPGVPPSKGMLCPGLGANTNPASSTRRARPAFPSAPTPQHESAGGERGVVEAVAELDDRSVERFRRMRSRSPHREFERCACHREVSAPSKPGCEAGVVGVKAVKEAR